MVEEIYIPDVSKKYESGIFSNFSIIGVSKRSRKEGYIARHIQKQLNCRNLPEVDKEWEKLGTSCVLFKNVVHKILRQVLWNKKSLFLPNDKISILCGIWPVDGEVYYYLDDMYLWEFYEELKAKGFMVELSDYHSETTLYQLLCTMS